MTSTRASPFIGFTGTTSFQTSSEVIGMKEWISCDEDLKKHGEVDPSPRTRKQLGILRDIYRKTDQSESANVFSGHQTRKMLEGYHREFELQKSKVIMHVFRLQSHLI